MADRFLGVADRRAYLIEVLLLGRLQAGPSSRVLVHLAKLEGSAGSLQYEGRGQVAALFAANHFRAWYRRTYGGEADRWATLLEPLSNQEVFNRAAAVLADLDEEARRLEADAVIDEARRGDFAAVSLLVMLLRGDLAGQSREGALELLAGLGTREAWFFLVDELPVVERLPRDIEWALRRSETFSRRLPPLPEYGEASVERFLAWQFAMRLGLKHAGRLPSRAFLLARGVPHASLPVVVPREPPGTVDEAARKALALCRQLLPEARGPVRARLSACAAAGDEVAAALLRRWDTSE
jgi:hypothetical protein